MIFCREEKEMEIVSKRLKLRPICLADAKDMYDYGHQEKVATLAGFPANQSIEECEDLIRRDLQKSGQQKKQRIWGLCLKGEDKLIGTINFTKEVADGVMEMGYVLHPDYWGQGYMMEAAQAFLKYGFEVLNLRKVELGIYSHNTQSKRLAQKLGFQQEGAIRQRKFIASSFRDRFQFGLLKEEWEKGVESYQC